MLKEKLFKILFPKKVEEMKLLRAEIEFLNSIEDYEEHSPVDGLPDLDFANVDEDGKPPHYLKGLKDVERKNFIANLEGIYSDEKFQTVFNYVINVIANYSFQKEPDESKMKHGRYAVIGLRTLMKQLEEAHNEHMSDKKKSEEFDPLDILPG